MHYEIYSVLYVLTEKEEKMLTSWGLADTYQLSLFAQLVIKINKVGDNFPNKVEKKQ